MPIQIIDNFDLGASKPIDNRIVVGSQSFYTNKDNITHKYPGMRVWDLDLGIPFVWTGSTFSSENSSSISGNGTTGYLPRYILSNVIGNSQVFDTGTRVGIGTIAPAHRLDVDGTIRSIGLGGFYGVGANITGLNATNISSGSLSLQRITNGTSGQILVAGPSQPQWTNTNQITVGTSSAVTITNDTSSASTQYLTFVSSTSGSSQIKVSSSKLQFTPQTGKLSVQAFELGSPNKATISYTGGIDTSLIIPTSFTSNRQFAFTNDSTQSFSVVQTFSSGIRVSDGSVSSPSITFTSDTNTGFYRPTSETIAVTTNGSKRVEISNSGVQLLNQGSLVTVGSYLVPSTAGANPNTNTITVSSVTYDRIVYLISGETFGAAFVNSANDYMRVQIQISSELIYTEIVKPDGVGVSERQMMTMRFNHCFILPATKSATITFTRYNTFRWDGLQTQPNYTVKTVKLGLN